MKCRSPMRALLLAACALGCSTAGAYPSIRHAGKSTYLITSTERSGPSRAAWATLFRCVLRGALAQCAPAAHADD